MEKLESAIVPPEIQTEGFVVFENSPDTQRFGLKENLRNFGNISITMSSFDSRHPDESRTVTKEVHFEPGQSQSINMEMPEMKFEMPNMRM